MASMGAQYFGGILPGDHAVFWVATPADWLVRLPNKRAGSHYESLRDLLTKAHALRMQMLLVGPPGCSWKLAPIQEAIQNLAQRNPGAPVPCRHQFRSC
eukprot:5797279-Pyramimonas_sp.AAC.1